MPEESRHWVAGDCLARARESGSLRLGGDAAEKFQLAHRLFQRGAHGFVFLGIATLSLVGVTGAVLVMVAHGFLAALTFALSGYLYQQTGTLEIKELGGLLRKLPFIGTALIIAAFAGCGLPGFANFVAK